MCFHAPARYTKNGKHTLYGTLYRAWLEVYDRYLDLRLFFSRRKLHRVLDRLSKDEHEMFHADIMSILDEVKAEEGM